MIVLYNPWSTPSQKKPLPMSLLAVASALEGEHEYEIVDGNLHTDPAGHIIALGQSRKLTAIAFTVMPGPQLIMPCLTRGVSRRPCLLCRLCGVAISHRSMTMLCLKTRLSISASTDRASKPSWSWCAHSRRAATWRLLRHQLSRQRGDPAQSASPADPARPTGASGRTTRCQWSVTSTSTIWATASVRITPRMAAHSPAISVQW